MSRTEIEKAIRATVKALKADAATGKMEPNYQQLVETAIQAAEKVVGADTDKTKTGPRRRG